MTVAQEVARLLAERRVVRLDDPAVVHQQLAQQAHRLEQENFLLRYERSLAAEERQRVRDAEIGRMGGGG